LSLQYGEVALHTRVKEVKGWRPNTTVEVVSGAGGAVVAGTVPFVAGVAGDGFAAAVAVVANVKGCQVPLVAGPSFLNCTA
jgi:hypothetical protein